MSDLQVALTNTAGITSIISFWIFVASNAFKSLKPKILGSAFWVLLVGFIALTCAIVARGIEAQRFPLSNLYESLLWFAWAIMGAYLWLAATLNHAGVWHLGWLASLTAASFFIYGSWLPQSQHDIQPLVPALVSYWRQIHVPPLIVSYAMFFLSGLSGLVQLWWAGRRVTVFGLIATISLACLAIALGTFSEIAVYYLQALFVGGSILGVVFSWLNLKKVKAEAVNESREELYDDISYRCISVGFPLLTIGIITGGLWANHAWGSYWSWDPKESMALVTWLSYAAYIHLRIHREIPADKLAVVSCIGLLLTLLTYLGFNTLGFGGLHSYGQLK